MKQFNTFAANSPSHSGYHSPKAVSPAFALPAEGDNPNKDYQRTGHFIKLQKIASPEEPKEEHQLAGEQSEQDRHSQVSLLLSDVSVPSPQRPQYDARRLFALESNITQNILELREQKITLMQELSKLLDQKNLYQHFLSKKAKEQDDSRTDYESRIEGSSKSPQSPEEETVPTHISAQILRRNEQLHRKLKELQIKEEIFGPILKQNEANEAGNKKILQEIIQVRELNTKLKGEIAKTTKPTLTTVSEKDGRFVTFLPQDKQKHQEEQVSQEEVEQLKKKYEELEQLKEKYAKLATISKQPVFQLSEQEIAQVEALRKENRELLDEVEEMLRQKQGSDMAKLRQRLQENQSEKSIFLKELQKFKNTMKSIKDENAYLKHQLSM